MGGRRGGGGEWLGGAADSRCVGAERSQDTGGAVPRSRTTASHVSSVVRCSCTTFLCSWLASAQHACPPPPSPRPHPPGGIVGSHTPTAANSKSAPPPAPTLASCGPSLLRISSSAFRGGSRSTITVGSCDGAAGPGAGRRSGLTAAGSGCSTCIQVVTVRGGLGAEGWGGCHVRGGGREGGGPGRAGMRVLHGPASWHPCRY